MIDEVVSKHRWVFSTSVLTVFAPPSPWLSDRPPFYAWVDENSDGEVTVSTSGLPNIGGRRRRPWLLESGGDRGASPMRGTRGFLEVRK